MTSIDAPAPSPPGQERPPPWRDVRILRAVLQTAFLIAVIAVVWWLGRNLLANMRAVGLSTGWGLLNQPTGFDIQGADIRPGQPVRDAFVVGFFRTIQVAVPGIVLALLLGTAIGVLRLSPNFLVRKAAAVYVEVMRNTPVVLICTFMYLAVALNFPPISQAVTRLGVLFTTRGVWVPWGETVGPTSGLWVGVAIGAIAAIVLGIWRTRRFDATGEPHRRILIGAATFIGITIVAWALFGRPVRATIPELDGRVVDGGLRLLVTYFALLTGLVLYTASHIAEIIRGSILAVHKGQGEAADALALSTFQRLRYVILPQAFRIAVPPLTSQFLNLTKNTSLAVAVAHVELFRVTFTVIGNGNPAPQSVAIMMGCYLFLSLVISLIANIVNRSLSLETR